MTIPRITRFYYEEQPSMPPLEDIHTSGAYAKEKELQRKKIKYGFRMQSGSPSN